MTDRFPKGLAAAGLVIGSGAALFYARQGLTLSHYDAKAHLVVARRILDSLTPEYSQIGAVWLPLPHLLNLLPVQIDALYRTGASGVAFSVLAFALACYSIASIVLRVTGSRAGALLGVALFALDPNVLYLQSTPMTEPLLFGLTLLSVLLVYDLVEAEAAASPEVSPQHIRRKRARAGWALIAACLTRYEAWFVMTALITITALALWRSGRPFGRAVISAGRLAIYPAIAIAGFFVHSWYTTGEWFVTGGFYVPDNLAQGRPFGALMAVMYGMRILAGRPLVYVAIAGFLITLVRGLMKRERSSSLVVLALAAFLVLPSYAFYQGHPFRMRYMVAPIVGVCVFAGIAVGTLRGWRRYAAAGALAAWMAFAVRPLAANAPMVQEAQWDRPRSQERRVVTACLMREYRGELILASMGSLAHYMQELSREGLGIRKFVHEGNFPLWQESLESPLGHVKWILIEEQAEGGDMLAERARRSSAFLSGFTRVCEGGGVALYEAQTR